MDIGLFIFSFRLKFPICRVGGQDEINELQIHREYPVGRRVINHTCPVED